jgi:hypothetical protein
MISKACIILVFAMATLPAGGQGVADDAEGFFEARVRPVLAGTCFKCHGGKKTSSGLRVDSREALLKGGERGPAVVPGAPEKSLLVQAIGYGHDDIKMPPDKRMPESVAADFATWVKHGAVWPKVSSTTAFQGQLHWAFEPVRQIEPPPDRLGWSNHPVDRLLAMKWSEKGLQPARAADKRTLLRRVTFDLIGLPPTPEESAAFLADRSPSAYEAVVERLLASPRYGERWGRYWLDVARYADTAGDNADYPVPEARLYRDYIIDAFNADKPYDQFVQEQLAGDLFAREGPHELYAERVIATGFLALSRRYATAPEELWHLTLEDTIETTGRAFLGLTLRCARCHDHKFDPVTRDDYYGLYGIFASTQFPYAGSEEFASMGFPRAHFASLRPASETKARLEPYTRLVAAKRAEVERIEKESPAGRRLAALGPQIEELAQAVRGLESADLDAAPLRAQLGVLHARREQAKAELKSVAQDRKAELRTLERPGMPADLPAAYAVCEGTPVDEAIHIRGDPAQRGPVIARGAPRFLAGHEPLKIPKSASGRLELARWLARADHPLTARVMVNRIWQHHFGRGIVASASNFGLRGEEPTHPELLDWLAGRFVAGGWSIKAIHRLIASARAYQMASQAECANEAIDPANRWLWRFDRQRLDAEAIRDAMLAVSGRLELKRPGPHPFPPIAQWGWTQHNPFKAVYPSDHRSVYLMTQRLQRHPYLALFDGPDTNSSIDVRARSTVALQALYFMNNPFVNEQAEGFARRLLNHSADREERIIFASALAWGRPPRSTEVQRAIRYVQEYTGELAKAGAPADRIDLETWTSYAKVMLTANEFLYVD